MSYFGKNAINYVTLGWSGEEANKVPAAKSLAKGLAAGAIELIMALGFRAVGAAAKGVVKGVKAGAKAVKSGAQATVRLAKGAFTVMKTGAGLVAKGFRAVVKAGKFVFQGIKRGFMKVVKTFKDLGKKLLARFKFKGFKIVRKGRWFQIFGKINPWILLATGKIEYIEADDLARLNKPKGGRFSTGQTVKVLDEGDEIGGVVVGINRNADDTARRYVEEVLKPKNQDELAELYKQYSKMDEDELRKLLNATTGETAENARQLRAAMEGNGIKLNDGEAAHHIVPSTHSYQSAKDARQILDDFDININDFKNGVGLTSDIHSGLHTHKYMDRVLELLENAAETGQRSRVISTLESIGKQIKGGNFP